MRWSFASVGVIVAGIIGIVIILLFQQITTNNESDYYLLKEITEAAMIESIDVSHYRETGELKIVREKFVENFIRRFAESTNLTGTGYTINFYDIMETPPKASILINTGLGQYKIFEDTSDYNVQNKLDAILEYVSTDKNLLDPSVYPYIKEENGKKLILQKKYYYVTDNKNKTYLSLNSPEELDFKNIKNIKIDKVELEPYTNSNPITKGEFYKALLEQNIYYKNEINVSDYYFKDFEKMTKIDTIKELNFCNNYNGNREGTCNGIPNNKDPYWIIIDRYDNDKYEPDAIARYNVTWSYEEYKLS